MLGLQWATALLIVATVTCNCQTNNTEDDEPFVWCPHNFKMMIDELGNKYKHCEYDNCIDINDIQQNNSKRLCLDEDSEFALLKASCNWVRLLKDVQFILNLNDGSIYEMKTNLTYKWGDYVYLQQLQQAIVCRQQLLPDDDTKDITLWCSSHTIYMSEYQFLQENDVLYLLELHKAVPKGLYNVSSNEKGRYRVDICLKMDVGFMSCEILVGPDNVTESFHLQDDLSYLIEWQKGPEVYPVGQYGLSADQKNILVCLEPIKPRAVNVVPVVEKLLGKLVTLFRYVYYISNIFSN